MDELQWLVTNFEEVTVAGLLALALFALYREWIVFGRMYHECRDNLARFEQEATELARLNASELAELRQEIASTQRPTGSRKRQP